MLSGVRLKDLSRLHGAARIMGPMLGFFAIGGLSPAVAQVLPSDDAVGGVIDPESPLAPMPDIGIDWPDMAQPDIVAPIAAEDDPEMAATPEAEVDVAAEPEVDRMAGFDGAVERRYRVSLAGVDDIADARFRTRFDELSILKEGEGNPANIAQLNRRIKEDRDLLDRLMRAKGYYDARIRGSIAAPAGDEDRLRVTFDITPGTLYLLSSVDVDGLQGVGAREAALRKAFPVAAGDPIDADRIMAGVDNLKTVLGESGFPFAKVDEPVVRIDHEERDGDLDLIVATGGYRSFGRILMSSERIMSARHVQRIARFRPGDTYMASDVEDLRRALVATGLLSSINVTPQEAGDGQHVDLNVAVAPAPPHTIAGEIGYGTGEGFKVEANWQHRNLFPPEGGLTVRAVAGTQEQGGSVTYRRNNFRRRDNVLTGVIAISNTQRDAYDARTVSLSAALERQTNIIFQKKWVWSIGPEFVASDERGTFSTVTEGRRTFLIAALPTNLIYDGSDDLLNPSRGFRIGGRLSPEVSFQNGSFTYVRAQVDGSLYQPFGEKVVLAARTRMGSILGSDATRIAPTRRFYAGGGGSVRGFGYQEIGPRDANDDPIGGKSLAEFSLEARIRFGNFGVVPFLDAGNISEKALPDFKDLRIGAGLGVRYYSSFGPIRIDVGTPINRRSGEARVAVYVSLGQAF